MKSSKVVVELVCCIILFHESAMTCMYVLPVRTSS